MNKLLVYIVSTQLREIQSDDRFITSTIFFLHLFILLLIEILKSRFYLMNDQNALVLLQFEMYSH